MEMTTNETSLALLESIIAEDVEAYAHQSRYIKKCAKFPKKIVHSSVCAAVISLIDESTIWRRFLQSDDRRDGNRSS